MKKNIKGDSFQIANYFWEELTPHQQEIRREALRVLSLLRRKGYTLNEVLQQTFLSEYDLRKHLGNYLTSEIDTISRRMYIYEAGERLVIGINNSTEASLLGHYFNDVRNFLETGDITYLKRWDKVEIIDDEGRVHRLETDPESIYQITEESEAEGDYNEIYAIG